MFLLLRAPVDTASAPHQISRQTPSRDGQINGICSTHILMRTFQRRCALIETNLRFGAHAVMRLRFKLLLWRRSPVYPRELFRSHQVNIVAAWWRFSIVSADASPCRHCGRTPSYLIPCKLARATARSMASAHHMYSSAHSSEDALSSRLICASARTS